MSEFIIEFRQMSKEFPSDDGGTNLVLNGINLRVRTGEFVCLVGGSGSGKSTLFNHALGTLHPTSGEVLVNGTPVQGEGPDRGIVPQSYSLYPHLRVADNIGFGLMLSQVNNLQRFLLTPTYRKARRDTRRLVTEYITELGLEPSDANRWPHELSGGMKQRVAIGTALIKQPKVLMMDEPFGALDPETRTKLQKLTLRKWKELGLTVIFVTHMMEEAVLLADRVVGLSKYWLDNDGKPGKGATIVLDRQIAEGRDDKGMRREDFADSAEFHDVCTKIHRLVLDTTRRVAQKDFDLSHPDAASRTALAAA
ncbi:MAG TPA: ATP-binding cassette domain-containing protein [Planktothrix sp.]|jgi:NitT/TauT family transport system ATP-binding protein